MVAAAAQRRSAGWLRPRIDSSDPTEVAFAQIVGKWRPAPIRLADPQIAVISDACAWCGSVSSSAKPEANLPTALVDARGESIATAILADEVRAVECRVGIDAGGAVTVDSVIRLASATVVPSRTQP